MRNLILVPMLCFAATAIAQEPLPQWNFVEDLRIGSINDSHSGLTMVGDAALGPDGMIYVTQPMDSRVRVFDRVGGLAADMGRSGRGPGEFGNPHGLSWLGDTLAVYDAGYGQFALFLEGHPVGSLRISSTPESKERPAATGIALLKGRSAVALPQLRVGASVGHDRLPEQSLLLLDSTGRTLGILGSFSVGNQVFVIKDRAGLVAGTMRASRELLDAFDDGLLFDAARDGSSVVLVDRSAATSEQVGYFSVTKIDPFGQHIYKKAFQYDPIPAQDAHRDRLVSELAQRSRRMNPLVVAASIRSALRWPEFYPPVSELIVGRDGTIWLRLQSSGRGHSSWYILDSSGGPLATTQLPSNIELLDTGRDVILGVVKGALDVPFVVRMRRR